MSRREDIDNAIWSDPDFHGLSPHAKLVYLWSFTNPRCGMAGVYKVVLEATALETGLPGTDVRGALEELREGRFVTYRDGVIWVRSRVKHLRTKTPQIAKSIARDLERITGPIRDEFMAEYRHLGWLATALATLNRGSAEGHENFDTYAETGDPHPRVTRTSGEVLGQGKGRVKEEQDGPSRARARRIDPDTLPGDFPFELTEPVNGVLPILTRLHEERGGKPPTRRGVALAVRRYPRRDHVSVAYDLEQWATVGNGANHPIKNWDQRFATFLDHATDAAPSKPANDQRPRTSSIDDVIAAHERFEREQEAKRAERARQEVSA